MDDSNNLLEKIIGIGLVVFIIGIIIWGVNRYNTLIGQGNHIADVSFVNEAEAELDEAAIRDAADDFSRRFDIQLGIYFVEEGSRSDLVRRATSAGFMADFDSLDPNSFIIYIGVENEYSDIGWGSDLERMQAGSIRTTVLNSRLQEGDFTGAILSALSLAEERLSNTETASDQVFIEIFSNADEAIVISFVSIFLYIIFKLYQKGVFEGLSTGGSSSSLWDSSSSYSSWDSGSSSSDSSSSSSSDSGGGFDGGGWSD